MESKVGFFSWLMLISEVGHHGRGVNGIFESTALKNGPWRRMRIRIFVLVFLRLQQCFGMISWQAKGWFQWWFIVIWYLNSYWPTLPQAAARAQALSLKQQGTSDFSSTKTGVDPKEWYNSLEVGHLLNTVGPRMVETLGNLGCLSKGIIRRISCPALEVGFCPRSFLVKFFLHDRWDPSQMVVSVREMGPRLFQGNLGWWNVGEILNIRPDLLNVFFRKDGTLVSCVRGSISSTNLREKSSALMVFPWLLLGIFQSFTDWKSRKERPEKRRRIVDEIEPLTEKNKAPVFRDSNMGEVWVRGPIIGVPENPTDMFCREYMGIIQHSGIQPMVIWAPSNVKP